MKRILLITVRSDEGGGPKHVGQILEHLQGDFEFYTASPYDPPYYEIYSQKSVGHFFLPHRKASLMKAFDLLFWCRDNRIDFVHTHGRGAAFYGFFLGLLGVKTTHTFHGVHKRFGFINKIIQFLERFVYIFCSNLIFVSESEKQQAEECGFVSFQKSAVIPNGVDVDRIESEYSSISTEEARAQFHLPKGVRIIGTLSRLDPHKQNDQLILAMKDLPGDYHLAIAGDGEQKIELEKIIEKYGLKGKISLLGNIDSPITFLKAIDIYASFSKGEGHPYSVLEAMACNKPILLSNVSGHSDMLCEEHLFNTESELIEKLSMSVDNTSLPKVYKVSETTRKIKELYSD
jgi:glycosyltransferase involved in cell wall biosynthesis